MSRSYYQAYIGTNSVRGSKGIYTVHVDTDTLEAEIVSTTPIYNSGSVALSRDESLLYAAVEGMTFNGYADGGVVAYRTSRKGVLTKINGQRAHGQRTCCVAVDDVKKNVYACNFYRGSLSVFDMAADGGIFPARLVINPPENSDWKALHCVGPIKENYVGVISLAECALVIYRADTGERVTSYQFPDRPFPRYFEVSGNYIYAMMQSPDDIYVFENRLDTDRKINLIQKISVMDEDYQGMWATSTVRAVPNGELLLAANRPSNSITVFRIREDGTLERGAVTVLPGEVPRDFHISRDGKIVVSALQKSNEICIHRIDYENAALIGTGGTLRIPSPASVAVSGRIFIE